MSWLSAYKKHTPHVPEDDGERLRLLEESKSRLAATADRMPAIRDVTIPLRARNDLNHYAQGLQQALGLPART